VLNGHKEFLVINVANELGVFHRATDETLARTAFRDECTPRSGASGQPGWRCR